MNYKRQLETVNPKPKTRGRGRAWLFRLGYLTLIALLCFWWRAPLLMGVAELWIDDEPIRPADALLVLGGGTPHRPIAAARLYHAGTAPMIMVPRIESVLNKEMERTDTETDAITIVLEKRGVPETSVQLFGWEVASTQDEALALRDWASTNAGKKVIIVTDAFHARRVRWTFKKALKTSNVQLQIHCVNPERYDSSNWWQSEYGLIAFQNELIKFAYYLAKY